MADFIVFVLNNDKIFGNTWCNEKQFVFLH